MEDKKLASDIAIEAYSHAIENNWSEEDGIQFKAFLKGYNAGMQKAIDELEGNDREEKELHELFEEQFRQD